MDYMKRSIMNTGIPRVSSEEKANTVDLGSQEGSVAVQAAQEKNTIEFYDDFISGDDYLDLYTES